MDFYEVGVYLLIIIVAAGSVLGVMLLLTRSMQPQVRRVIIKDGKKIVVTVPAPPKVKAEKTAGDKDAKGKKTKEKGKKKSKKGEDKLLKLKELPEDRLLPEKARSEEEAAKKSKGDHANGKGEKGAAAAGAEEAPQEMAEIALPDLPTMDTLTEGEEPEQEQHSIEELMSVFQVEDAEDSATSDLAANLFDVDVENIEKLGNEVAEFLGGMRSR